MDRYEVRETVLGGGRMISIYDTYYERHIFPKHIPQPSMTKIILSGSNYINDVEQARANAELKCFELNNKVEL